MKANELRVGNWVRTVYPVNKKPFQVWPIAFKQMPTDKNHDLILSSWEPIPLTEEWLLKFGFELEHEFTNAYKLYTTKHPYDCSNVTYSINEKMLRFSNGQNKGSTLIPHIKYVHQLQNLYFALTGEELTLEP